MSNKLGPIIKLTEDYEFVKRYGNVKEAADEMGIYMSNLYGAISSGNKSHGYYWVREEDYNEILREIAEDEGRCLFEDREDCPLPKCIFEEDKDEDEEDEIKDDDEPKAVYSPVLNDFVMPFIRPFELVKDYIRNISALSEDDYRLHVVWSNYTLKNQKMLITVRPLTETAKVMVNNLYFELTYSSEKDLWYFDVYKKVQHLEAKD